jgi:hydroxyethylthiazole kinase
VSGLDGLGPALAKLRAAPPLVHNITNFVVMNNTANALLALGASPAMVHAPEEVEDFVAISGALVINPGTLSAPWVASMRLAAIKARTMDVPWILDPVGVGATPYRRAVNGELATLGPAVIRGNASEVLALAGAAGGGQGVDATDAVDDAVAGAKALAKERGTVVAISGATDVITDGRRVARLSDGHPMMAKVTGMGCTATAIIGAFLAAEPDPFWAATYGLAALGVAGATAAERARGPGSLQLEILDALHLLDPDTVAPTATLDG